MSIKSLCWLEPGLATKLCTIVFDFDRGKVPYQLIGICMGFIVVEFFSFIPLFYVLFVLSISDPTASADLAVVLMQEGLAHILLVGRRYE